MYLRHRKACILDFIYPTGQTEAMYRDSVLSQLIIFVAFTKVGKIDMFEWPYGEADMLRSGDCGTLERRGLSC